VIGLCPTGCVARAPIRLLAWETFLPGGRSAHRWARYTQATATQTYIAPASRFSHSLDLWMTRGVWYVLKELRKAGVPSRSRRRVRRKDGRGGVDRGLVLPSVEEALPDPVKGAARR
jgi:hypothetical protein